MPTTNTLGEETQAGFRFPRLGAMGKEEGGESHHSLEEYAGERDKSHHGIEKQGEMPCALGQENVAQRAD